MDLNELATSIIDDARREAAKVDSESHEQVMRYETETEKMLRERREKAVTESQRRRDEAIRRESAKMQRDARLTVLVCKRELIDEVFEQARNKITATKGSARKELLRKSLARARRAMTVASVTATKSDTAALRSMGVRVRGTTDGTGGFLAHDSDEKVGIDLRFNTILEQVRTNATGEIANILFARETPMKQPAKRKRRTR